MYTYFDLYGHVDSGSGRNCVLGKVGKEKKMEFSLYFAILFKFYFKFK